MDGSKRASTNLIFYDVLINMMLSLPILFIVRVFGSRIESFLHGSMLRGIAAVMSERTLVGRSGAVRISTSTLQDTD
jgi:hypothetical protein